MPLNPYPVIGAVAFWVGYAALTAALLCVLFWASLGVAWAVRRIKEGRRR